MTSTIPKPNGRIRSRTLTTTSTFLVVLAAILGPAPGVEARPDGLIVFESDRGGHSDIWVMESDGSNQARLTDDTTVDLFPAWSTDGKKIAWTRGGRGPEGEIWLMNADGSDKRQLTFNGFSDYNATFSPDGSEIAFRSFRGGNRDIFVMKSDGTDERRLTDDPASDFAPDWSPDGARIVFTSLRSGASAIYIMNSDGTDERQLTPDFLEAALPGWSPDGDKIVFADGFCDTCGESDVFVMNPDGTGITQVTDSAENELGKSWSRSGDRVVVDFSTLAPSGRHLSKGDIAVVDIATGAAVNVTDTPGISEEHPDWSSGGRPAGAAGLVSPRGGTRGAPGSRVWASVDRSQGVLHYSVPRSGPARLRVFDVRGREVEKVLDAWRSAGTHTAPFSVRGKGSQVYLYRLEWEGGTSSGKLIVVK